MTEKKRLLKKKRKKEKGDGFELDGGMIKESHQPEQLSSTMEETRPQETGLQTDITTKKSTKSGKKRKDCLSSTKKENSGKLGKNKKNHFSSIKDGESVEAGRKSAENVVYEVSSGDEDSSKGMKKWIIKYHQSRPGLKVLQDRIDEFITAHEAQQEQARKEREAQAADGGWTVVVHHKGRKKTIDSESGISVGSVAQAAVVDKMAKKKSKEVGLDFYRFQRREAQRNELMMLQSKFEQDKKRIQQLRAARKFKPY